LALGTIAPIGGVALANEDSDTGAHLEEIVVTATKRGNESVQNVPIAIDALSGEQMQTFGIQTYNQIDMKTPGLVFTHASGYQEPYIRGIGADYPGIGLEPPVATYVDDVYYQRATGANFDLVDMSSIEVLKGPQGTLYGRNATGGAILLTTNNPTNKDEGSITLEGGNLGHKRGDLILNYAFTDRLAVRLAARYDDQDGYLDNPVTGVSFGGFQSRTARLKISYTGDVWSALLSVDYNLQHDRVVQRQADPGIVAPECVPCAITGATPPPGLYETFQNDAAGPTRAENSDISLKLTGDLGPITVMSITAGHLSHFHSGTDEGAYGGAPSPYAISLENAVVDYNDGNDLEQEFRVLSHFTGPVNFLAGLNGQYSDERNEFGISGASFTTYPGGALTTSPRLYTYSVSPYADLYFDLTSQLKLTVGGRFNKDRKDTSVLVESGLLGPAFRYDDSWNNFTPHAILSYEPDKDQTYYFSYSTGFKSGGFNLPSFAQSPTDILQPEKIKSFEVGAKNRFLNDRIQTTAAVFYYDYKDVQVAFVSPGRGEIKQNAASAKAHGVELDAQFAATDQLTLGAGYAYLHARFTDYPNASINTPSPGGLGFTTITANLSGTPLTRAPDNTLYASGTYTFPVTTGWKAGFTGLTRFTSAYDFNPDAGGTAGLDMQRPFAITNFSGFIGTDDDRLKLGFFVNNAFDRFYLVLANTSALGAYRGPAAPRTFGGNISYRF
jgi:iron complex outermembrane receptor protein